MIEMAISVFCHSRAGKGLFFEEKQRIFLTHESQASKNRSSDQGILLFFFGKQNTSSPRAIREGSRGDAQSKTKWLLCCAFMAAMPLMCNAASAYERALIPPISGAANMCIPHMAHIEKKHGIPGQLLTAIAQVESGRWNKKSKTREPWPWAVHAEGKGHFFATKADAIQAVRKMLNRGVTNIDVGCMQINISHHGHAFQSLSHMFDPAQNVAYAGKFLKGLKGKASSWFHAVAHYHSATPVHHIPYRKKVYEAWAKARHPNFMGGGGNILSGHEDGFESLSTHQPHTLTLDSQRTSVHPPDKASPRYGLVGARRLVAPKRRNRQTKVQVVSYEKRSKPRPIMIKRGDGNLKKRSQPLLR